MIFKADYLSPFYFQVLRASVYHIKTDKVLFILHTSIHNTHDDIIIFRGGNWNEILKAKPFNSKLSGNKSTFRFIEACFFTEGIES